MSTELADSLSKLQRKASHCAWLFQSYKLKPELRVAFVAGDACPWRLIETHHKADVGVVLRRMHCFAQEDSLRSSIEERARWKARDRALVAGRLPRARQALSQVGATELHTAQTAQEGLDQDLAALEPERRALREQLCVTKPDRVIDLLVSRKPDRAPSPHSFL